MCRCRGEGSSPRHRHIPLLALILAGLLSAVVGSVQAAAASGHSVPNRPQGGAIASDPVLHLIYLAQPLSNSVFVLSADGSAVLGVLSVPPTPIGLAVDSQAHLLYVASGTAGVITVFSEMSRHVARVLAVGGRPAGIALSDKGKALLVADGSSGKVRRISMRAKAAQSAQVLDRGPGADLSPILIPKSAPKGTRVVVWGRGFAPRETVEVYWGLTPLVGTRADAAGIVLTHFSLPRQVHLGKQLIVLIGKHSTHSESTLLTVIKSPPPPKPAPIIKPVPKPLLARLLAPHLLLTIPSVPKVGPLKALSGAKVGMTFPAFALEVLIAVVCLGLILRMRHRRRKRASITKAPVEGGKGVPPQTLKGAA